jgi:hypothetical protein
MSRIYNTYEGIRNEYAILVCKPELKETLEKSMGI